ncbi:phosphate transporter [Jimgerdemannia flammicorona]|uniref:Phosphate transporter n=1 Tax=Jimgerdemannia flammicorona TaxID=994334 RepID=A0A433DJM9_9FUNG|nr:phosphate transporter [Jimgerdemannia flammicorona]
MSTIHREEFSASPVLQTLEQSNFNRNHLKAVVVSGVGFLADMYDLFSINIILPMIGFVYFSGNKNTIPTDLNSLLTAAATVGAILGQLVFGFLSDRLGRKRMYGIELLIVFVATLGACLASNTGGGVSIIAVLGFWRVVQGVGIGAATISAEFSNRTRRGAMLAAVFSMQGVGILLSSFIGIIFLQIFKGAIEQDVNAMDHVWRIITVFGVVPAAFALYYRLTIPESPRYTLKVLKDSETAERDVAKFFHSGSKPSDASNNATAPVARHASAQPAFKPTWRKFRAYFGQSKNAKILIGTSLSWFLIDIAVYGLGLNNSLIIQAIGFAPSNAEPFQKVWLILLGNLIVSLLGNVPGYFIAIPLVEIVGRRRLQLVSFAVLTVVYIVLAVAYNQILQTSVALFMVIYTLGQFFIQCGPNSTTFIIPVEVFPTQWRSTGHGISAAAGKLGAAIASYGFGRLAQPSFLGVEGTLGILAGVMFCGTLVTYFLVPETKGLVLPEDVGDEHNEDI